MQQPTQRISRPGLSQTFIIDSWQCNSVDAAELDTLRRTCFESVFGSDLWPNTCQAYLDPATGQFYEVVEALLTVKLTAHVSVTELTGHKPVLV
jgi:hypothetical protein